MMKIYITFLLIMFTILINSCNKNPLGSLPPIEHQAETFEEHLDRMTTPGHVYFWINNFAVYDTGNQIVNEFGERCYEFNQNWYHWNEKNFPDQAYALAYELWANYLAGENRGVCGQFAATYVVSLRRQGYRCGGICTFRSSSGHAEAWIEDKNGKIIVTSNRELDNLNGIIYSYKSYDDLVREIKSRFANDQYLILGWFLNEKFEVVFDKTTTYDTPMPLSLYKIRKLGKQ